MLKLVALGAAALLVAGALLVRMDRVQAQMPPCVPVTALSTTCAPVTYPVTICSDQLGPYAYPSQFFGGYYSGMSVAFFGSTYFYNAPNPYNFYNSYPNRLLELTVQPGATYGSNTIVGVKVLPSLCAQPAPTPTVAPTIVYVPQPVVAPAPVAALPRTFDDVKAGIAAIQPPRTGDAGLKGNPHCNGNSDNVHLPNSHTGQNFPACGDTYVLW